MLVPEIEFPVLYGESEAQRPVRQAYRARRISEE